MRQTINSDNKEIPKTGKLANNTFQLSGKTGSLSYMAPEVAKEQPYNETVDVYSLAILAWQIFEMDTPYKGYSIARYNNLVVEKGGRPKLNPKWGDNLCTWLKKAWSEKISDRPSTRECTKVLQDEFNLLQVDVEDFSGRDASNRTAVSVNGKN